MVTCSYSRSRDNGLGKIDLGVAISKEVTITLNTIEKLEAVWMRKKKLIQIGRISSIQ